MPPLTPEQQARLPELLKRIDEIQRSHARSMLFPDERKDVTR